MAKYIYLEVLSPARIGSRSSGRAFLETLLEEAPEWSPEKHNDVEPVNRPFDPARLEESLESWSLNFLWRRKQPLVHGSAWFTGRIHSSIYLNIARRAFAIDAALRLLQGLRRQFPIDLAYIHVAHDSDSQDRDRYRRHVEPFVMGLTTHRLHEGLPDLPWAMLFGPPYIELFLRQHLLKTPAAHIEETAGGVYVQLTPTIVDVTDRREAYLAAQRAARAHLDNGAFLADSPGAQVRVPEFPYP